MDYAALEAIINPTLQSAEQARNAWRSNTQGSMSTYDFYRSQVLRGLGVAQTIADSIPHAPTRDDFEPADDGGCPLESTYEALLRLQGLLSNGEQLESLLPDAGPARILATMETGVRQAAAPLWNDGYRRAAIHTAASQIENRLQAKLGREDVSGAALIRQAFTLEPPQAGRARLRFPDLAEGGETYRSTHEGAAAFGAGCFQLIRNTAAHAVTELAEEVAIEHLASLSLLARLIGYASIERSADDAEHPPDTARPFG